MIPLIVHGNTEGRYQAHIDLLWEILVLIWYRCKKYRYRNLITKQVHKISMTVDIFYIHYMYFDIELSIM